MKATTLIGLLHKIKILGILGQGKNKIYIHIKFILPYKKKKEKQKYLFSVINALRVTIFQQQRIFHIEITCRVKWKIPFSCCYQENESIEDFLQKTGAGAYGGFGGV